MLREFIDLAPEATLRCVAELREDSKRLIACGDGKESFARVFMFDRSDADGSRLDPRLHSPACHTAILRLHSLARI